MNESPAVEAVPTGMHTVTPHLVCSSAAKAIDFYRAAFGAVELMRIPGPGDSLIHAAVRIGDSMIMLAEESACCGTQGPLALGGSPVTIHLQVEDVDALFRRAVDAGASVLMDPAEMFWGDRYGQVVDPFGHQWSIATHVRDVSPEELAEAAQAMATAGASATAP